MSLLIRNVEIGGGPLQDVRIEAGRVVGIGHSLGRAVDDLDGQGGALIPGLCDHHIHLFGLAAQADTVMLDGVVGASGLQARISTALATRPAGDWVRAMGYHEAMAGDLTSEDLDRLAPHHRLRIQHQTGALWILNSLALESLADGIHPPGLELDCEGRPTGRLWREDRWLRARIGAEPPRLAPVGRTLAAYGITAVTDASVTTDADAADRLARAHRAGALPQRLTLMSGGELIAPPDGAFAVGPVKVLLDDHALPEFDDFVGRIGSARAWGRNVAVHCVTAAELALSLAAFETAGTRHGDRIEHGGVIPRAAIDRLRALNLTVVTQSAFVRERGDRYLADVDPADLDDLYRCGSLLAAGIPVAGSSDAPYASPDPWLGMATAMDRLSGGGQSLGAGEAITGAAALALYLDEPGYPGCGGRAVTIGDTADLCLLKRPIREVTRTPHADSVRATFIGGRLEHLSEMG
jgi:predicted amidohydrolase YtcJ